MRSVPSKHAISRANGQLAHLVDAFSGHSMTVFPASVAPLNQEPGCVEVTIHPDKAKAQQWSNDQ